MTYCLSVKLQHNIYFGKLQEIQNNISPQLLEVLTVEKLYKKSEIRFTEYNIEINTLM